MSHYTNKCFNNNCHISDKLIIFIHGYNGDIEAVEPKIEILLSKIDSAVIVTPESPIVCEKNAMKKQWFSTSQFDECNKRRDSNTALEELVEIYNKSGELLEKSALEMNIFIDEMQKKYAISDEKTYIIGFSQGAQLAIFTALSRKTKVAGCISIAGIVAGKDRLGEVLSSTPKVLLLHGKDDVKVQYKSLDFSLEWLKSHNIEVQAIRYDNLDHRISEEELDDIAKFINE